MRGYFLLSVVSLCLSLFLHVTVVHAQDIPISACGTYTESGSYYLATDIVANVAQCVVFEGDNVQFRGAGKKFTCGLATQQACYDTAFAIQLAKLNQNVTVSDLITEGLGGVQVWWSTHNFVLQNSHISNCGYVFTIKKQIFGTVLFRNNTFVNAAYSYFGGSIMVNSFPLTGSGEVIVEDNTLISSGEIGISYVGRAIVRNNVVSGSMPQSTSPFTPSPGIGASAVYAEVYNNVIYGCKGGSINAAAENGGVLIMRNNTVRDVIGEQGFGVSCAIDATCTLENNTLLNITSTGGGTRAFQVMCYGVTTLMIVRDNIIDTLTANQDTAQSYNCISHAYGMQTHSCRKAIMENNIVRNFVVQGINCTEESVIPKIAAYYFEQVYNMSFRNNVVDNIRVDSPIYMANPTFSPALSGLRIEHCKDDMHIDSVTIRDISMGARSTCDQSTCSNNNGYTVSGINMVIGSGIVYIKDTTITNIVGGFGGNITSVPNSNSTMYSARGGSVYGLMFDKNNGNLQFLTGNTIASLTGGDAGHFTDNIVDNCTRGEAKAVKRVDVGKFSLPYYVNVYDINGVCVVPINITACGTYSKSTIYYLTQDIEWDCALATQCLLFNEEAIEVQVVGNGHTISCNHTINGESGYHIHLESEDAIVKIDNLRLVNGSVGVYMQNAANVSVTNSVFTGGHLAVKNYESDLLASIIFTDNKLTDVQYKGVELKGNRATANAVFERNQFVNSGGAEIHAGIVSAKNNTFFGPAAYEYSYGGGINMEGVKITVVNNTFDGLKGISSMIAVIIKYTGAAVIVDNTIQNINKIMVPVDVTVFDDAIQSSVTINNTIVKNVRTTSMMGKSSFYGFMLSFLSSDVEFTANNNVIDGVYNDVCPYFVTGWYWRTNGGTVTNNIVRNFTFPMGDCYGPEVPTYAYSMALLAGLLLEAPMGPIILKNHTIENLYSEVSKVAIPGLPSLSGVLFLFSGVYNHILTDITIRDLTGGYGDTCSSCTTSSGVVIAGIAGELSSMYGDGTSGNITLTNVVIENGVGQHAGNLTNTDVDEATLTANGGDFVAVFQVSGHINIVDVSVNNIVGGNFGFINNKTGNCSNNGRAIPFGKVDAGVVVAVTDVDGSALKTNNIIESCPTETTTTAAPDTTTPTTTTAETETTPSTPVDVIPCAPSGRVFNGQCICQSGYGGADCSERPLIACGAVEIIPQLRRDENFPVFDNTVNLANFTANVLFASIRGPVVANRTYTNVSFVGATNPECFLGTTGSYWQLSADTASCADRIALTMPWSNHSTCGFNKHNQNAPNDFWQFKGTVLVTYTDLLEPLTVGDSSNVISRRASVSFEIYVHFQKYVEVSIEEIMVNSSAVLKAALTGFSYDPEQMHLTVQLTTILSYPNQIKVDPTHIPSIEVPDDLILVDQGPYNTVKVSSSGCGLNEEVPCHQTLEFNVAMNDTMDCDFDGEYDLNVTVVTCRGTETDICTWSYFIVKFTIADSYVCGTVSTEPVVKGKLVGYSNPAMTEVASDFNLGETGFFTTDVESNNDITMTYADIWVVPDATDDEPLPPKIYFLQNGQPVMTLHGRPNPELAGKSIVDLKIKDLSKNSNLDVNVYTPAFSFNFHGFVFQPEVGKSRGYTLYAIGNVTYLGNENYHKKREEEMIDFVWKVNSATLASHTNFNINFASESNNDDNDDDNITNNNALSYIKLLIPVIGFAFVAIVVAIAAAIVIIKKNNNNTSSYRTLN